MNVVAVSILYGTVVFLIIMTISEISTIRRKRLERKLTRFTVEREKKEFLGKFREKIKNFLMRAGLNTSVEEFLFINLLLYIIFLTVLLLAGIPVILTLFLSLFLPLILLWYLNLKKERRKAKVEKQMEGFLIDLSGILAPIPNIIEALKKSTENLDQPLKEEILKTISDVTSGNLSLKKSLRNLSRRFDDRGLVNMFSIALIQADKIGTKDTGKLLKRYADIARRNQRIKFEANAKLSYSRTQKNILLIGVVIIYIFTFILTPQYIRFYTTKVGIFLLIYSIISISLGLYILDRLTNITGDR
jgi:Flp pilus assembly protein TadB